MKASLCVFAAIAAVCVLFSNVALAQEAEVTTTAEVEMTYRVLPGDTIGAVARDFGFEPVEIIAANASREGVLINHCGYLPRRVRAYEATPARCAWLREGVDITIPSPRREEAIVAPPVLPPPFVPAPQSSPPLPEESSSILSLSLPPNVADEGQLRRVEDRVEGIVSGLGGSVLSLHRKVNELSEGQELSSQKLRFTNHLLYLSLSANLFLFLLGWKIWSRGKRWERLAKRKYDELSSKINALSTPACSCGEKVTVSRRSPAPSVAPPPPQGTGSFALLTLGGFPPDKGNGGGLDSGHDAPSSLLDQPLSPREFGKEEDDSGEERSSPAMTEAQQEPRTPQEEQFSFLLSGKRAGGEVEGTELVATLPYDDSFPSESTRTVANPLTEPRGSGEGRKSVPDGLGALVERNFPAPSELPDDLPPPDDETP